MSGPTPLLADFRLVMLYTANGLQHHQNNYVEAVPSSDPAGYDISGRLGLGNPGLSTIPDHIFGPMAPFYPSSGSSFDGFRLDQRVSGAWVPVATATTTITPTGSSNYQPAVGIAFTGKSELNQNMPVYLYEGGFGQDTKFSSYAALSASMKALLDVFWAVGRAGVINDLWNVRTSRNLSREKRWLAVVIDSNEKLRRKRGIK